MSTTARTPSASAAPAAASSVESAAQPAFVPDFSNGLAGGYVLDFRDPITHAVLVQIPMRTAFAQFADLNPGGQVGKTVDTAV